ncbi:hypothetical protein D3C81_1900770 [compost metagenome]
MPLQRLQQTARQYSDPILHALAVAYQNLSAGEVHILDPQAQHLHQPHARAIQQTADQPEITLQAMQHPAHLFDR